MNGRSMTAEIVARLEASLFAEDLSGEDDLEDAELLAMLADIENLKRKLLLSHRRRKHSAAVD